MKDSSSHGTISQPADGTGIDHTCACWTSKVIKFQPLQKYCNVDYYWSLLGLLSRIKYSQSPSQTKSKTILRKSAKLVQIVYKGQPFLILAMSKSSHPMTVDLTIASVTVYGSQLLLGRRSSRYPWPSEGGTCVYVCDINSRQFGIKPDTSLTYPKVTVIKFIGTFYLAISGYCSLYAIYTWRWYRVDNCVYSYVHVVIISGHKNLAFLGLSVNKSNISTPQKSHLIA